MILLWLFSLRLSNHITVFDYDAALITGTYPGSDRLQPFALQPGTKLLQCLQIHLLQLVQKNKATLRI